MGNLTRGTQYYWRIDAVNGVEEWPGDVWSFTTVSQKATEPNPVDTAKYVGTPRARVSWKPGTKSTWDAVYFGTNQQWVIDACEGVYQDMFAVTKATIAHIHEITRAKKACFNGKTVKTGEILLIRPILFLC